MGDIGAPAKEIEYEPLPTTVPVKEPSPAPVPEREPVPA
jgi:hypothetical protein